jgi:hypothetical protein
MWHLLSDAGGLVLRQGALAPAAGGEFMGGQDSVYWTASFIYRLVHNAPLLFKYQGLQVAIASLQPCGVAELNLYLNCTKRQIVNVRNF